MVTRPLPAASRRRTVAYAVVKRLLKMDEEQFLSPVFQARSEVFLRQRIAGQFVQIKVGSKVIDVGVSNRTGHFETSFDLDGPTVLENSVQTPVGPKLYFESVDIEKQFRPAQTTGYVQLVDPNGISVISDKIGRAHV